MFNELLSQLSTAQVGVLDIELVNVIDFKELVVKFGFNLLVTFVVVYFIYAKNSRRKDFFFSYFAISTAIFALCFLLESVKLELGIALGLFAIFGIIRYRTDTIPIKEMTYLFVIIGLAVINALSSKNVSFLELLFTNVAILGTLWILELILMLRQEASLDIVYEKIENINLNKRDELVRDIQERTGIKIKRIEIEEINFMRDIARIRVFHDITESNGKGNAKK